MERGSEILLTTNCITYHQYYMPSIIHTLHMMSHSLCIQQFIRGICTQVFAFVQLYTCIIILCKYTAYLYMFYAMHLLVSLMQQLLDVSIEFLCNAYDQQVVAHVGHMLTRSHMIRRWNIDILCSCMHVYLCSCMHIN